MRLYVMATLLLVACAGFAAADDEDASASAPESSLTQRLADADPLAAVPAWPEITRADKAFESALRGVVVADEGAPAVRLRAARLGTALRLADRVHDGKTRDAAWWLALDEIDRVPSAPVREALLARAFVADDARVGVLQNLADARAVALRFCTQWNELDPGGAVGTQLAALRAELEDAGLAAVPTLLEMLTPPPAAVFTVMHEERGITARQGVRALFGLGFVDANDALPYVVYQVRGPSFTQSTTAQALMRQMTGEQLALGGDEATSVKSILAWWTEHGADHAIVFDHLVRHVLVWTRSTTANADAETAYWARFGPTQLALVVGHDLAFPEDGDRTARLAALDALELDHAQDAAR